MKKLKRGTKRDLLEGVLYILPFMFFWAIFLAWPVVYGVYLSLHKWEGPANAVFVGFGNYADLFSDARFWNAFFTTINFALIVIPFIMVLGLGFALVVWSWEGSPHIRDFIQAVFFFPFLLTISIIALIWRWVLDADYGILLYVIRRMGLEAPKFLNDTSWVLWILAFITAWWLAGYRMLVFQAGLEDIPTELFEAAKLDGAGRLYKLWFIILPLLKPSILFTLVLTIIAGFRTFGQVFMMTEGGPGRSSEVLALYLYRVGFDYFEIGKAAASGVVLLLLILVVTMAGVKLIGLKSELQ
jgi:ABC-type sugar transport system permease subunit